jgi:hypothetical protein
LLDSAPDKEDIRIRLRAAVRRTIEGVWVLAVGRGRVRLCAAQVVFAAGGRRNYLIAFKMAHSRGAKRTNAVCRANSFAKVKLPDDLDLSDGQQAAELKTALAVINIDELLPRLKTVDW